jgi:hypothetical protein
VENPKTHRRWWFIPPPGVRFTLWQERLDLEFERGREEEVMTWMQNMLAMWRMQMQKPEQPLLEGSIEEFREKRSELESKLKMNSSFGKSEENGSPEEAKTEPPQS